MFEGLTRCRVLARQRAGVDRIDIATATRCGIVVSNVPDFCFAEQAEHPLALLLCWRRRLPYLTDAMRRGDWSARHHPGVHRLAGQTLGLVGFGASARAVAVRAQGFDLRILAWARNPDVLPAQRSPVKHALLELDNLILTPHCAGSSVESTRESKVRGVRIAADLLLGHLPRHVVNPEVRPCWPLRIPSKDRRGPSMLTRRIAFWLK